MIKVRIFRSSELFSLINNRSKKKKWISVLQEFLY